MINCAALSDSFSLKTVNSVICRTPPLSGGSGVLGPVVTPLFRTRGLELMNAKMIYVLG